MTQTKITLLNAIFSIRTRWHGILCTTETWQKKKKIWQAKPFLFKKKKKNLTKKKKK